MEVTGKITERKGHTLGGACVGDEATIELSKEELYNQLKLCASQWSKDEEGFTLSFDFSQPKPEKDNQKVKVPKRFTQAYSDTPSTLEAIKEKLNEIIKYLEKRGCIYQE